MSEFLTNLIAVVGSLITILTGFLKSDLGKMIVKDYKSGAAQKALNTLNDVAFSIVAKYQQTLVADLRVAAHDGKITKEELKTSLQKIKEKAQEDFSVLATGGFKHLLELLVSDNKSFSNFLDTLLESAIHRMKGQLGTKLTLPTEGQPSSTWSSVTIPPITIPPGTLEKTKE